MVLNYFKLIFLFQLFCLEVLSQGNNLDYVFEVEHYRSDAKQLKKIVNALSDSCKLLYDCHNLRKIKFFRSNFNDSVYEISVSPIMQIGDGYLKKIFEELEGIILMVDSVSIVVKRKDLLNSCLSDSIEYIGKMSFDGNYEEFESCLQQYGLGITMRFSCLSGFPAEITHYGAFIPTTSAEKKLRKALKKKERTEFRKR